MIFDVHPCLSLTDKADYSDLIKIADQVAHEKVNIQAPGVGTKNLTV